MAKIVGDVAIQVGANVAPLIRAVGRWLRSDLKTDQIANLPLYPHS